MKELNTIAKETLDATKGDAQSALYALEDGQYLSDAGYNDDDQGDVEEAHAQIKAMLI